MNKYTRSVKIIMLKTEMKITYLISQLMIIRMMLNLEDNKVSQ